ncbi:MAG TPA: MarC family protein [Bauldia sp.]|nr:MarC family protein [Bauldia sp.]
MGELLRTFITAMLLVPATLLPIINPLVGAPIFMAMTGDSRRLAARMASRVGLNCFFLLLGSLFVGGYVLEFFGVSIPAVRVAGGILVGSTAWRLLNDSGQDELRRSLASAAEEMLDREIARRSFLPMTFPLTVGPGTIAAAITLGATRPEHGVAWVASSIGALVGLAIAALAVYLTYRYASRLLSRLGDTGTLVLTRLAAFLLLAIGIDILWSGLAELIRTL